VRNHRRWILVSVTVAAVGLAFASVAYACTTIVGSITTTYKGTTCNNWPLTGPPPPQAAASTVATRSRPLGLGSQ